MQRTWGHQEHSAPGPERAALCEAAGAKGDGAPCSGPPHPTSVGGSARTWVHWVRPAPALVQGAGLWDRLVTARGAFQAAKFQISERPPPHPLPTLNSQLFS